MTNLTFAVLCGLGLSWLGSLLKVGWLSYSDAVADYFRKLSKVK